MPNARRLKHQGHSGEAILLMASVTKMGRMSGNPSPEEITEFLRAHKESEHRIIEKHNGVVIGNVRLCLEAYWPDRTTANGFIDDVFTAALDLLSAAHDSIGYKICLCTARIGGIFGRIPRPMSLDKLSSEPELLLSMPYDPLQGIVLTEAVKERLSHTAPHFGLIGQLPNNVKVFAFEKTMAYGPHQIPKTVDCCDRWQALEAPIPVS